MPLFRNFLFVLLAWYGITSSWTASAQTIRYSVEFFTSDNGLPGTEVNAIHEDLFGFMWFGTDLGLVRSDGLTFTLYQHIPNDSTSLGGKVVNAIIEDEAGNFWLSMDTGISYFNRRQDTFTNYPYDEIGSITRSTLNPDHFWLTTSSGLTRFQISTGLFTQVVKGQREESPCFVCAISGTNGIIEDEQGVLWISGIWGLWSYDPNMDTSSQSENSLHGTTQYLPDERYPVLRQENWRFSWRNDTEQIVQSNIEQSIYWVSSRKGLHKFDRKTKSFETYYVYPDQVSPIDNEQGVIHIPAIHIGQSGDFWVSTRDGLFLFDPHIKQFSQIHPVATWAQSIYESRNGTIWVGSGDGLRKYQRSLYPFTIYGDPGNQTEFEAARGITEDDQGNVLISTRDKGLFKLDPDKRNPHFVPIPDSSVPSDRISGLLTDVKGTIWIARGPDGLEQFNPKTGTNKWHLNYDIPPQPSKLNAGIINHLHEDSEGTIWVSICGGGVNKYNPSTGHFSSFKMDLEMPASCVIRTYQPPSTPDILWVATYDGPTSIDKKTGQYTHFHNENFANGDFEGTRVLLEDGKQRFWIGTIKGLHLFDRETETYTTFNQSDGLPHDRISSILEDNQGRLWIGTGNGLSRYDPDTGTFKNFSTRDGLPYNDFQESGFLESSFGEFFFLVYGNGDFKWFSFFPDQITDTPSIPSTTLTRFDVKGIPADIAPESVLQESITFTDRIELSYNQDELTLHYAGLGTRTPELVQYQYRLTNYDEDWVEGEAQRSVRYNRLPPGDYSFEVRSGIPDHPWGAARTLDITIDPPWWSTTFAYFLYTFGVLGLVFGVNRYQRQRLIAKERQQAQIREAELQAEAAHALSREATAMNRALQAENERNQLEIEKGKELEKSYRELQQALAHLRETQDQLVHTEKLASLGQLTAGIAHEIKNPLNFVNNFSRLSKELMEELEEWIRQRNIQPDKDLEDIIDTLKMNVVKIHHHGNRADGIVKSMLEHSRTEPGQQRATDVNKLLDEYVNLAFHSWKAAHTDKDTLPTITRDYDEQVGEINLIPQNIGRVLINLLDNALYAVNEKSGDNSPESGVVRVKTVRDGEGVEITIEDNGIGIPEGIQEKIFEPFFTTKPTGSGTGLGLSLSYDIVVQGHGGELKVESEEGEGATFAIRLPV